MASPAKPRPPERLDLATVDEDDLRDEVVFQALGYYDLALTGRSAKGAAFVQCRFNRADLTGAAFVETALTDCLFEDSVLGDLRADRSDMRRVTLTGSTMTGLHWLDGSLADVTIRGCQADGASFRGSRFAAVRFEECDLSGADFSGADLTGVSFVRCDLAEASFAGCDPAVLVEVFAGALGVTLYAP